jgi:stage III sporulation protein AB
MRVLLAGLVVALGVCLSYRGTNKYTQRERILVNLLQALTRLENLVCYYRQPLSCAYEGVEGDIEGFFRLLSNELQTLQRNPREMWENALAKCSELHSLTKRDKACLLDFGTLLGQTDGQGQKELFIAIKRQLDESIIEARADIAKRVKLYRVLGFAVGATVAIIII